MYTTHYKLKSKPFQISSDPAFLWLGEKHQEALATLKYGVLDNKGFMLLTGDVGTGKTTLINALIQSLSEDILYASVTDPRLELIDFLNYIARAFGISGEFKTKGKFLLYFKTFLERAYEDGKKVVLLIDEAQLLTQDLLEEIRLLSNIQKDGNNLLNIFFVGQDEFNEILERPENRAVAQRLTLNYHLKPLTPSETREYVRHRLLVAGTREQLFDDEALQEVYAHSGGFPRRINIICDHCLLNGFVKERQQIDPGMVINCARDLRVPHHEKKAAVPPPRPIPPVVETIPRKRMSVRPKKIRTESVTGPARRGMSWPVAALICLGMLAFLYLLSPSTFKAKYSELEQYLLTLKQGLGDNAPLQQAIPATPEEVSARNEKSPPLPNEVERQVQDKPLAAGQPAVVQQADEDLAGKPAENVEEAEVEQASEPITGSVGGGGPPSSPAVEVAETESDAVVSRTRDTDVASSRLPVNERSVQPVSQPDGARSVEELPPEDQGPVPQKTFTVRFDPNSSDFYFTDLEHVDAFVDNIKNDPGSRLVISGHTDSYGSESYNQRLSLFRANMLKSFFLGKGIPVDQLVVIGFGSKKPIASNATPEGRQLNRRVEIEVVR